MYIFYRPDTLEIRGMSNDKESMQYPTIETSVNYHSTLDLSVERKEGIPTLKTGGLWEGSEAQEITKILKQ